MQSKRIVVLRSGFEPPLAGIVKHWGHQHSHPVENATHRNL